MSQPHPNFLHAYLAGEYDERKDTVARQYYEIHVEGKAREIYAVMAKDETDAKRMFERGNLPKPLLLEVNDAEVVRVVKRELDEH